MKRKKVWLASPSAYEAVTCDDGSDAPRTQVSDRGRRGHVWRTGLASVVITALASTGTIVMTVGTAAAQSCAAPQGKACVLVRLESHLVKSIRVDGQCLYLKPLPFDQKTSDQRFGSKGVIGVSPTIQPTVSTYLVEKCAGFENTEAHFTIWDKVASDNFRTVLIQHMG